MDPLLSITVTPKTQMDRERLRAGLQALIADDPTIAVRTDHVTGATIIAAGGEQQLEIVLHRLAREFGVEASVGPPQVAFKETVTVPAEGERKVAARIHGRREYGHAKVRVYPGEPGSGYVFENAILGGAIPERFIEPVNDGIKGALTQGILAGYPVIDVRVQLYDGSYHDVDSSELAFQIAGSLAFQNAARHAQPILLEPMMLVEVRVPGNAFDTAEDLLRRRAHILAWEKHEDAHVLRARAPLAAMFGYASDLRWRTNGRAAFSMRPAGYAPVSPDEPGFEPLGVPATPKRPPATLGPMRIALPEPDDEQT